MISKSRKLSRKDSFRNSLFSLVGGLIVLWILVANANPFYWRTFGKGFVQTDAIVISADHALGGVQIAYMFTVDGHDYSAAGWAEEEDGGVSARVPIYYDPQNPGHSYTERQNLLVLYLFIPALLGLLVACIGAFFYYFFWGFVFGQVRIKPAG